MQNDNIRQSTAGQTFGNLTTTGRQVRVLTSHWRWLEECVCVCGAIVLRQSSKLRNGYSTSCGCLTEVARLAATTTHGLFNEARFEYRCWATMIQRCVNPKNPAYEDYGGRGITVCDRWRESFEAFYADMGPRPPGTTTRGRPVYSLDRINVDGHYEPGNCRWATWTVQNSNRRRYASRATT